MNIDKPDEVTTCWVQLYSDGLYSWALHKTSNKETAEDLVQETFLVAVKSAEQFRGDSNPKTWLFSILNNKINDHFRKSYRNPVISDDAIIDLIFDETEHWKESQKPQPWLTEQSNLFDDAEFQAEWQKCLQRLPAHWNAAVQLKFIDEKKSEEVCQELAITDTNFWQILHRAKLQLRKCLELNWFKK